MNEAIISKIIELLNKPLHYLGVGILLIIWGTLRESEDKILIGVILLVIAILSYAEKKYKIYIQKEEEKKKQEETVKIAKLRNEAEKKAIIDLYKSLSFYERDIIDSCIKSNCLVYEGSDYHKKHITSLMAKGFGISDDFGRSFVLKNKYFKIIKKYIEYMDKKIKTLKKSKKTKKKKTARNSSELNKLLNPKNSY